MATMNPGRKNRVFEFSNYWSERLEFLDVHYHANVDQFKRRYNAVEAGEMYRNLKGGVVLKNHLGSCATLASLAQSFDLPVFGSIVLNDISGGLKVQPIKNALCQYEFKHKGRMLVHLPTIVPNKHKSKLIRSYTNKQVIDFVNKPIKITGDDDKLLESVKDIIKFAADHDIVISTGHATKHEVYTLVDYINSINQNVRVMLNQPANPITGLSAKELREFDELDWLYTEQTALTLLLGYQSFEDFADIITNQKNVVYSSDLGQVSQIDIPAWRKQSATWFKAIGLTKERVRDISLETPLKMLDPD